MVRPAKPPPHHHSFDDDEEPDFPDDFTSSFHKVEEAGKFDDGKKGSAMRSKHSETEQRRRSKINERFQILRELIPQNDLKRDKASFLLEVIEYIQFLQDKLRMYEGSYHGYNQEQSKLTPWGGSSASLESHVDPSQVLRGGTGQDNRVVMGQAVLTGVQNLSELGNPIASVDMQTQSDMFPCIQHGVLASDPVTESVVGDVASNPQTQMWQVTPGTAQCMFPNNVENDQEQLTSESDYSSFSSAYSQGILSNLAQALQSSGVDLTQASISVQIDVGKRGGERVTSTLSRSKDLDHINLSADEAVVHNGAVAQTERTDHASKRSKTEIRQ